MPGPHDKIIADAAKAALGPFGFHRKGQSRLWFADHGWWLTIVEFQPSAWSKGSYLNVGAQFLWVETGSFSFDFGGRLAEFVEYQADEQFAASAVRFAECAVGEARRLDQALGSISETADVLLKQAWERPVQSPGHPGWIAYHAGVAAGLLARSKDAAEMFRRILTDPALSGSLLYASAKRMADVAAEPARLRTEVVSVIRHQRDALRLPPLEAPL